LQKGEVDEEKCFSQKVGFYEGICFVTWFIFDKSGLGGGIGIKVLGYNLDYVFVPYAELGTTQRVSFSAKF